MTTQANTKTIQRKTGAKTARRLAAASLIAVCFAAILVHGRATRPAQPQFAKTMSGIEIVARPITI